MVLEFCEVLSRTRIDLPLDKQVSAKEMPAKPQPTMI